MAARDPHLRVMIILAGVGSLSALFAAWVLWVPQQSAEMLGYRFVSQSAKVEFATVYGGFFLGLGIFWLLSAWRAAWRAGGAASLALASTGAALARGTGLAVTGVAEAPSLGLLGTEIVLALLGWGSLCRMRRKTELP